MLKDGTRTYRHGDVDIIGHTMPKSMQKDEIIEVYNKFYRVIRELKIKPSHTLALGETSGHKHVMTPTKKDTLSVMTLQPIQRPYEGSDNWTDEGETIEAFLLKSRASLVHEEHSELTVEEGFYFKRIEVEYDPFHKVQRVVID